MKREGFSFYHSLSFCKYQIILSLFDANEYSGYRSADQQSLYVCRDRVIKKRLTNHFGEKKFRKNFSKNITISGKNLEKSTTWYNWLQPLENVWRRNWCYRFLYQILLISFSIDVIHSTHGNTPVSHYCLMERLQNVRKMDDQFLYVITKLI